MLRRKSRNSTAYTGVGPSSPAAQQPNNNAMAAALTIGQNLKQTQPNVYGHSPATVTRSPSTKPAHTTSLLKRNSSFQGSIAATSTPRQSRTNSALSRRHSTSQKPAVQEFDIDDSFTDASFDQMGIDADNHYNNAARVSDLKLHHIPAPKPQQKMVKKYIPTPNGIKIIEVPADTMKNDIARSNSMRSGMSLGHSGSFQKAPRANSLSTAKKQPLRKPTSRLSSISSQPRIDENAAFDPHPHSVDSSQNHTDNLQQQIEHEKQLAKDLEDQREKFLKLKELRLKNERKMRELQILQEEEASHSEESRGTLSNSRLTSLEPEVGKNTTGIQSEETAPTKLNEAAGFQTNESSPTKPNETAVFQSGEPSPIKPLGAAVVADDYDDEEDVPVAPVPFVVDEMESKQLIEARKNSTISTDFAESDAISHSSSRDSFNKMPITTSPHDAVVNSYGDTIIPFEESTTANSSEKISDYGIEEIPKEYFDSPELSASGHEHQIPKQDTLAPPISNAANEAPSPSFDPVPEIIGDLVPPANIAGSIRSFSSTDSKSRPIKSAMKNPKTKFNSPGKVSESPANKAYLSLTTAENTRLNSKLSSSQLQEFNAQQELKGQNSRSQLSAHSHAPQIQSLRKQPSGNTQGSGLSGRSLRPQSMAESPSARSAHGGGMSSRSFKTQSTIQPIPAHNFHQSSSKLRAAELYAKANSRPTSEFQPLQRKSSFTREGSENLTATTPTRRSHRTTLRTATSPQSSHPVQSSGNRDKARPGFQSNDGSYPVTSVPIAKPREASTPSGIHSQSTNQKHGFKSRFDDSDDEQSVPTNTGFRSRFNDSDDEQSVPHNTGFRSRFNDSDDEGSQVHAAATPAPITEVSQHKTMRVSNPSSERKEKSSKEKKPKKKFLKKLFGRD